MKNKIAFWIATVCGIGRLPGLPGTFGSIAAIPIIVLAAHSAFSFVAVYIFLLTVGVWSSRVVAEREGKEDPTHVVVDEVCGMLTTFLFIPLRWQVVLAGFFLFRLFDILKPFGIRRLERIGGGFGIVLDDVAAGIYSNIILWLLIRYAHM